MMRVLLLLAVFLTVSMPCMALTEDENSDGTTRTIADYIEKYVDVPAGATDWKIFGATKEITVAGRDKDGMDFEYVKPEFAAAVQKLDGQTVTVKGFIFPLEGEEAQHEFLLGPFPVSCPFHYHVGPSLVLEVHTPHNKPIEFSYDPVTLTGQLELVPLDLDTGVFYRLKDARAVR